MPEKNNISESEWKILEILWSKPGLLIGEIRDALSDSGWSYSTIKTLVARLANKNILRTEETPKGRQYYPNVDEAESKRNETRSFLDRIYNGSVKMMFSNLVKDSHLSENETEELMSLIDKMED